MKKQMLLAAVAGLILVSAHPAPQTAPPEARSSYPPCSRTVTDRCIQLNERAVRAQSQLAAKAAPARAAAPARSAAAADDDIDVAYAGNVLQAPRAGHHPGGHVMPHRSASQPAAPHHAMPHHAAANPAAPHHPGAQAPAGMAIVRHRPRAHAVSPQAIAHSAHPAPLARPAVAANPYPACAAGVADRCRQQRHHAARRQLSMRVRRAGERG